jgi:hypothetical protein
LTETADQHLNPVNTEPCSISLALLLSSRWGRWLQGLTPIAWIGKF